MQAFVLCLWMQCFFFVSLMHILESCVSAWVFPSPIAYFTAHFSGGELTSAVFFQHFGPSRGMAKEKMLVSAQLWMS